MPAQIAIPWFSERDFDTILEMTFPDAGCVTYSEWVAATEDQIDLARSRGHEPYVIYVNPAAFEAWAKGINCPLTERSVADFCGYLLSKIRGTEWNESVVF